MSADGRLIFHERRSRLRPPLRPDTDIVASYRNAILGQNRHALMLGITPELADVALATTAVDISPGAIAHAWPGNTVARRALQGDWLEMPLERREFTAVIGDGSLSWIAFAQYPRLFAHLAKLLLPGARLAIRLYETPEPGETIDQVREAALKGGIAGFHAFKWRLAMAIVSETGNAALPVKQIHKTFERKFAQRSALSAAAGWTIDEIAEIDAYAEQDLIYYFPTRRALLAHLPPSFADPHFISSGDYELSERCPILVADFRP